MNKLFRLLSACALAAFALSACQQPKPSAEAPSAPEAQTDSAQANADTIGIDSTEAAPPPAVDELFADFIYSFSTNRSFQFSRIDFPLRTVVNGKPRAAINRIDWRFDKLYYKHSLHIIILDSERGISSLSSIKTDTVRLEQLLMKRSECRRYTFIRQRSGWRLKLLSTIPIKSHRDAEFLTFYNRFATDSAFQQAHLAESIDFVTYDADNHFREIEGVIYRDQWPAFRPELPADDIFATDYGLPLAGSVRVVSVRGNSNGMASMLKFRKRHGAWQLVKFEN